MYRVKQAFAKKKMLIYPINDYGVRINLLGRDVKVVTRATKSSPPTEIIIKGATQEQLGLYFARHSHMTTCIVEQIPDPPANPPVVTEDPPANPPSGVTADPETVSSPAKKVTAKAKTGKGDGHTSKGDK